MSHWPLLLFLAGLWLPSLQEVIFRCSPCTPERLSACPPGRPTSLLGPCAELVPEAGCGCCPVCARLEGESCGVYTPRCGHGLRCYPSPGSELPLQALVQGQGTCTRRKDEHGASQEKVATENNEDRSEGVLIENPSEGALTAVANGGSSTIGTSGKRPNKAGMKEIALTRDKTQDQHKQHNRPHKHPTAEKLRPPVIRTPCQQQLDQVLERISGLPLADERSHLEALYSLTIPNCDKNGLFNTKQCKMSLNGQRGECSCVDPNTGKQIPGAPTVRGDPECHLYYPVTKPEERGTLALRLQ